MSELVITLMRLGYLVALWLFVLWVVMYLRRDVYGTQVLARGSVHPAAPAQTPRARAPRGSPTRLHIVGGPLGGTRMGLEHTSIIIGRAPGSSLVLDDDYVSSRHARIFPQQGRWYVEDLGSTNGTLLGGVPVNQATELRVGSAVRIGSTTIELR